MIGLYRLKSALGHGIKFLHPGGLGIGEFGVGAHGIEVWTDQKLSERMMRCGRDAQHAAQQRFFHGLVFSGVPQSKRWKKHIIIEKFMEVWFCRTLVEPVHPVRCYFDTPGSTSHRDTDWVYLDGNDVQTVWPCLTQPVWPCVWHLGT